jgi:hypothetical protein
MTNEELYAQATIENDARFSPFDGTLKHLLEGFLQGSTDRGCDFDVMTEEALKQCLNIDERRVYYLHALHFLHKYRWKKKEDELQDIAWEHDLND